MHPANHLNLTAYITALAFLVSLPANAQQRAFTELLLMSDGFAHFGDEDYNDLPFSAEMTLAEIPPGSRELLQLGPLELLLFSDQVEMRVALDGGGEAFTSRPVVAGDLVRAVVTENAASLTVGAGTTLIPGIAPAADPGVFTLGDGGGDEVRVRNFLSSGGRIFRDGFESGDLSAWEVCEVGCTSEDMDPITWPTRVAGNPLASGVVFDGADDFIDIGTNEGARFVSDFTIRGSITVPPAANGIIIGNVDPTLLPINGVQISLVWVALANEYRLLALYAVDSGGGGLGGQFILEKALPANTTEFDFDFSVGFVAAGGDTTATGSLTVNGFLEDTASITAISTLYVAQNSRLVAGAAHAEVGPPSGYFFSSLNGARVEVFLD